ncbi:hypothetical protein D9757_012797 [Collybiopsis confluens]|uniref:Uncharacterized protein n=1 Tax=Collybiopsis confluens TaxID=2823264 RepID=A0A8H5GJF8_9AGAR|nr:hypothetical protein D9757_012797 [Collybiopsis confluens]
MSASMPDLSLVQHALTAVIDENSPPQLQSLKQSIDFYGKQLEIANPIWKAIQSREAIPADTSPTDWEHIANYWLPTQALVLLSNPDRKLISFGSKKQDYPPIKGIFEEVMAPFRKNHGWANVVEEAGKALAQFRKLEKIAGPSPVLSSSSNDGHIQHIFNQCDALSGTSTLVNIATNLNMAAIYLWWLQKGNLAFPRTLEEFESKLWITLPDGTRVQSLVLPQSMRLRYRSNNWEHPGHLALAISPICLLRGKALSRQSSDRTQVLNTAWCLGPHADRPPMLQKLEKWLWDNLVKMSQGTCTAFAVIENLFGENPWAYKLVKSLTGKDKAFFFNLNPNAGIIPGNAHIEELGPIIDLTNEEDDMLGEAGPSSMRVQQSTGKPASAEAQPFESKMESHELGSTEIIQPQQSKSNELFQEVSVNINHPEMSTSSPNEVEQGDSEMADIPSEVEKSNMDYSHQDELPMYYLSATVVIEDTEGLSKGEHHGLDIRMEDVAQNPKDQNANGTQDLEDLSAPELCPLDLTKSQPVPLPPATVTEKLSGMEVQHENDLATQLQAPLPPGKKVFDQVAGDDLDSGNTFSLSLSAAITGIGVINSWEDESQNEATTRSRVPDESNNQAKKRKRSNTSNDTPSNLATRQSARIEAKKLAGDYQEIFIPVTKSVPQKRAKAASASPSSEKEEIPEFDIQVYSKLIEGETHTLFNHNGRHSLEYTHFAHDNMSLKHLKTVLNSVNAQAKKDGRLLENGTFVPGGDDPNEYPISELSSDSWNCLSPQERQAWFGGNKILVIQRSNLPTSYQLGSKSHLQALVGDLDRVRTIQDGSRHAKKASDTHTHGTLAVMQEVVQSGKKVANCLEIPLLPSTVQYPSGLCTQDVAEAETGHPISHVGKTWGLFQCCRGSVHEPSGPGSNLNLNRGSGPGPSICVDRTLRFGPRSRLPVNLGSRSKINLDPRTLNLQYARPPLGRQFGSSLADGAYEPFVITASYFVFPWL